MQRQGTHRIGGIWPIAAALLGLLVSACTAHAQPPGPARGSETARVVVFGDVHGAYGALVELLTGTGVIGSDLHWRGGRTQVVSLGDLVDRGPDARRVLDLIMRLQGEAEAAGGALHVVLGNHEVMNLLGDWRYVVAADYAAFAAEETAATRAAAYAEFAAQLEGGDSPATRERFERSFPPGFFARQAAFAPTGTYGAWLTSLPAIVVLDGTAYVHGGLSALVAEQGLGVNAKLRATLARYLELRADLAARGLLPGPDRERDVETARAALATAAADAVPLLEEFVALGDAAELGVDGPLWYRGSLYCKPLIEVPTLEAALAALGARRVIVGHTPTGDRRVHALYDGKLVAADTGMLAEYFRGRPAALVLDDGDVEVRYFAPPQDARLEPNGSVVAYGRTERDLRAALEQGAVTSVERGQGAAPWRVALEHEGTAVAAMFYPRGGDGAGDLELAADSLDELLGTTLVAPTVPRAIEGEDGALQLRYPDAISEADRLARGLGFSGWCPIEPQTRLMYAFDVLTFNRGRAATNIVFANDLTDLTLTDHGRAFGTERALPSSFDPGMLAIPPSLKATLGALDEPRLTAALGKWLDSRRIRALLERRDKLLASRGVP
jgi:hypothetical protein